LACGYNCKTGPISSIQTMGKELGTATSLGVIVICICKGS